MVSVLTVVLAASAGFMCYLAVPFVVMSMPVEIRRKVGTFYFKLAAKSLKQFTFVRRILSGYDVLPISVDDEQKLLKVTLSSSMNPTSEDNEYPFKDPDNRIKRLFNKPVALCYEGVPAAIDASIAEWGYWFGEKHVNEGFQTGTMDDPGSVTVDTYVKAKNSLRLVDPLDAYKVVLNDVDPENVKTAEKKTKQRFEKYNAGAPVKQIASGVLGAATGVGMMMALKFFQNKFLDGSAGGNVTSDPISVLIDAGAMLL